MSQAVYEPMDHIRKGSHVDSMEKYKAMHKQSLEDPEVGRAAKGLPRLPARRAPETC